MPSLKHLKTRIKSIGSTQKITKAMQMVSASRLRRVKTQIIESVDYTSVLSDIMSSISYNTHSQEMSNNVRKFFHIKRKRYRHVLLVICTSERGLCGGFNNSIIKAAKEDISSLKKEGKVVKIILIGHKAFEAFKNSDYSQYIESCFNVHKEDIYDTAIAVRQKIMDMVEQGAAGSCYLYFNEFKNAIKQVTNRLQILPIHASCDEHYNYNYENEGEGLILNMINLYLLGQINGVLIKNKASEEAARMLAMDQSTKNAEKLINEITLTFNRTRQGMITRELIEIISGAEAL